MQIPQGSLFFLSFAAVLANFHFVSCSKNDRMIKVHKIYATCSTDLWTVFHKGTVPGQAVFFNKNVNRGKNLF
jgi:hypothetical protein